MQGRLLMNLEAQEKDSQSIKITILALSCWINRVDPENIERCIWVPLFDLYSVKAEILHII